MEAFPRRPGYAKRYLPRIIFMPIGYDYRCKKCDHQWMLFSTRLELGPTQWEHVRYTCFCCQTFLTLPKSVDQNSWRHWLQCNQQTVDGNQFLSGLAASIENQLASFRPLTPIELHFDRIACPTCGADDMLTQPFGEHPMRCPRCLEFAGASAGDCGISIYSAVDPNTDDNQ